LEVYAGDHLADEADANDHPAVEEPALPRRYRNSKQIMRPVC